MKTIHYIIAHPEPESLNYAMMHAAIDHLKQKHNVVVTDIYELIKQQHPAVQPYASTRSDADQLKIKAEQQKIKDSDYTIVQFPLYWFSLPGALKTYWEQVLEPGFAYPGKFENSPLHDGRKLLLALTTQSTAKDFSHQGPNGPMADILVPIKVAFRFVGYDIAEPFIAYNVTDQSHKDNEQMIAKYVAHVQAMLAV